MSRAAHPPLHALHCLRATLSRLVRIARRKQQSDDGGGGAIALEMALLEPTQSMHMMLAGCERLVSTPCPAGYVGVLRAVIILWLMLVPISLASELNCSIIIVPISSVISFLVLAIEEIAVEIENRACICVQH